MSTCSLCESALDHCHGTLIAHADGAAECTDWHCEDLDRIRHVFVADCSEVAGGCECLETEVVMDAGPQSLAG